MLLCLDKQPWTQNYPMSDPGLNSNSWRLKDNSRDRQCPVWQGPALRCHPALDCLQTLVITRLAFWMSTLILRAGCGGVVSLTGQLMSSCHPLLCFEFGPAASLFIYFTPITLNVIVSVGLVQPSGNSAWAMDFR